MTLLTPPTKYTLKFDFPLDIIRYKQTPLFMHRHDFIEVVFIISGRALHVTPFGEHEISRGDLLVIPLNGTHCYEQLEELELVNLLFLPSRLPLPLLELYNHSGYKHLFVTEHDFFVKRGFYPHMKLDESFLAESEALFLLLEKSARNNKNGHRIRMLGVFLILLSNICDLYQHQENIEEEESLKISELIEYMYKNITKPLTLEELAKRANLSRSSLLRQFHRACGLTPMKYFTQLRIEHAAVFLASKDLTVGEIAARTGFSDTAYFCRVFQRVTGKTPSEYRNSQLYRLPGHFNLFSVLDDKHDF